MVETVVSAKLSTLITLLSKNKVKHFQLHFSAKDWPLTVNHQASMNRVLLLASWQLLYFRNKLRVIELCWNVWISLLSMNQRNMSRLPRQWNWESKKKMKLKKTHKISIQLRESSNLSVRYCSPLKEKKVSAWKVSRLVVGISYRNTKALFKNTGSILHFCVLTCARQSMLWPPLLPNPHILHLHLLSILS